ncbi:unnamed protein product [Rotaria sordida]|uniref:Uncharacterized protein n=1 Tax=Rotaria sordida TaxID=392033 RepID=A0A813UH86_9BILA|nr:unnamed protein product [Rotaria sordida]CAF0820179.1 unnamed protein product [Rotaria sordida]CAF0825590.1 unnamed protein product [Rotaria sordida]CAF0826890.1 unnamed protein product [Rotaria sordida]CAF0834671.1 unnamed protein product [Rotaria sordida]
MFHTTVILILCFTFLQTISSQNLNGIFLIDSCECNSSTETCEPNGPFILNQKRSTLTVKYGSVQIGVGTLGNNQLDLYLNQNRCKGLWNGKTHLAELKCQHQGGIICTTKLRCLSGSCLDDTSIVISSASIKTTISFLFMIGILIMLV